MDRHVWSFAVVGVAAALRLANGKVEAASVVLGGVSPIPHRAEAAEAVLTGAELTDTVIREAARAALAGATPLSQNGYKIPLTEALVRRALFSLRPSG